jgi:hypothetical protein
MDLIVDPPLHEAITDNHEEPMIPFPDPLGGYSHNEVKNADMYRQVGSMLLVFCISCCIRDVRLLRSAKFAGDFSLLRIRSMQVNPFGAMAFRP